MVQWQLNTLDHLKFSGFGCPPPRHGLQLLFWFANECIKHDDNQGVVIELVTECQPDRGDYGFHPFGNIEEILPVLRGRSKKKKKGAYFEVGNLNTQTYPAADDLPTYVKENHGLRGRRRNNNVDRVIISYNIRTKIVDVVYVTEHDTAASGMFSPERTHIISPELIRTLQDIQLDVLLTATGYYNNMDHGSNVVQTFRQEPWVASYIDSDYIHASSVQSQQTDNLHTYYDWSEYSRQIANADHGSNVVQTFHQEPWLAPYIDSDYTHGSSVQSQQTDNFHIYYDWSEYSRQIANANRRPMSCREQVTDFLRGILTSNFTQRVREFAGTTGFFGGSGFSAKERGSERGSEKDDKKWGKLAMVLGTALLAAGALYLGAKCVSWLSGGGGEPVDSTRLWGSRPGRSVTALPIRRPHVFKDIPIMMFYVF